MNMKKLKTKYQDCHWYKIYLSYASIFMDEIETNSLDTQVFKLLVWLRYIDFIFFIWTHGKEKLESS